VKKGFKEIFVYVGEGLAKVQELDSQFLFSQGLFQEFIEQGGFAGGFRAVDKKNRFGPFIKAAF
jgi:hypothetical protein